MLRLFLSFVACLFLWGCSVEETITVQNLNLTGSPSAVPLHVTNDSANALRAVLHLAPATTAALSGSFSDNVAPASGKASTTATPGALRWTLPSVVAGCDLDLPLSHAISLALGANTSGDHWGCNAGFGFHSQNQGAAIRLDVGFQWQSLTYDVNYLKVTTTTSIFGSSADTETVHRSETNSHGDFYAALTVNSARPVGALNLFLQFAYAHQTLYDISSEVIVFPFFGWSDKTTVACSHVSLVPGFYIDFTPGIRVLAGARFLWPLGIDSSQPTVLISPVLLFDVGW